MLSNVTVEEQPCPLTPCAVLIPAEFGMPNPPPLVVIVIRLSSACHA